MEGLWEKQNENQDHLLLNGFGTMWMDVGFVKTETTAINVKFLRSLVAKD